MDCTHIAATNTSHRFLQKALSLSASFPMGNGNDPAPAFVTKGCFFLSLLTVFMLAGAGARLKI